MKRSSKKMRQSIYRASLFFTIIYFLLIYFQKRLLSGLFQTQLSFSIPDTISILTSSNAIEELTTRGTNGGIVVGVFFVIEVLVFISAIIYFLFKLWKVHSTKYWKKYDYVLVIGLIILLIGSFYYAFVVVNTSLETFSTVQAALNHLGPKQIGQLTDKWKNFIYHYQFSLGYLPRDISVVIDQVKIIIASIKEIQQLPEVINQWLTHLSLLKLHYFIVICLGSFAVISAQVLEYRYVWNKFFKFKFKKRISRRETAERVISIQDDQQVLIDQFIIQQEELEKTNKQKSKSKNYHRKR